MRFDIVGIDSPCVDLAVNVNRFPVPNGGERVQQLSWQGGGKVASGMVAAARLGMKCAIMGNVGTDKYGDYCIWDFKNHGIDTSYLYQRMGKTTGLDVVISDKETMGRSLVFYPGTSERMQPEEVNQEYLSQTDCFYLSAVNETTAFAADIARQAGARILIDADSYSEELMNFLPKIDVFIGSEFVYQRVFGENGSREENCKKMRKEGPSVVVFTFGEKGCCGLSDEGYFELPAFEVEVQDTVGAGDVFHGAFAAGLALQYSVRETARLASAVSAIKCTRIGGRAGIPSLPVVRHCLETGVVDYTEIDKRVELYRKGLDYV